MNLPPNKSDRRRSARTKKPKVENILKLASVQNGNDSNGKMKKESRPNVPDEFGPIAAREWNRVIKLLEESGMPLAKYAPTVELYCSAFEEMRHARAEIKKLKPGQAVMKTKDGNSTYQNQWLSIRNKAEEKVYRYIGILGFSPGDDFRLGFGKGADGKPRRKNIFDDM